MKLSSLITCASLVGTAVCSGQSVVQTVAFDHSDSFSLSGDGAQLVGSSFYTGTFDPFDSSLGTLDSFVIQWSLANTAAGSLPAGGSFSLVLAGDLTLDGVIYRSGLVVNDATGGPPHLVTAINFSLPVDETHTFLSADAGTGYDFAIYDAVTGSGVFPIAYGASFSMTASGVANVDAATSGSVSLTYHYTPSAVPEPSTYAALAGLGALGLALWRRRRASLPPGGAGS